MQFIHKSLLAILAVSATGCASRSYVDERMAALESRQAAQGERLDSQQQRIEELNVTSQQALDRAVDAGVLARGQFLYSVVLTDAGVTFSSDDSALSSSSEDHLNSLADSLMEDNRSVYLEIQGHTDSAGAEDYNQQLGLARADAVRGFLHEQGVALDRMATISYGEAAPIADNGTTAGRAQNRRVEIVVLE